MAENNRTPTLSKITVIHGNGVDQYVLLPKDVAVAQYEDVLSALSAVDGTRPKIIELRGFCDTGDRAPMRLAVAVEDILSVALWDINP